MKIREKIDMARKRKIFLPSEIEQKENIVGVYKMFARKREEYICFYIGKSTDISYRLLGSNGGHIYLYLKNKIVKLVPQLIKKYIDDGYEIKVEIIRVDYKDKCFSKASHRLSLIELSEIVKYQEMGQCLYQLPEGVGKWEEKFWEDNYSEKF